MNEDTVKCTYKHCRFETKEIPISEATIIGKSVYHKQCINEWNDIKEIKKLYCDKISQTVVQNVLGKVINNIIYEKFISSDYLLFALRYAVNKGIKINSPYGLHYIVDDYKIKNQWIKDQSSLINKSKKIEIINTEELPFYFNSTKQKGFQDIIKE